MKTGFFNSNNESGQIQNALLILGSLFSLGIILALAALLGMGRLNKERLSGIKDLINKERFYLSNDDIAILEAYDKNLKKMEDTKRRQREASTGDSVNVSYQMNLKKLENETQKIIQAQERLAKLSDQLAEEKIELQKMIKDISEKTTNWKKDHDNALDWASSKAMKKSIRIFNNMEAADIAGMFEKNIAEKKELFKTTEYLNQMGEELAAEVLGNMNVASRRSILDELNRIERFYEN